MAVAHGHALGHHGKRLPHPGPGLGHGGQRALQLGFFELPQTLHGQVACTLQGIQPGADHGVQPSALVWCGPVAGLCLDELVILQPVKTKGFGVAGLLLWAPKAHAQPFLEKRFDRVAQKLHQPVQIERRAGVGGH